MVPLFAQEPVIPAAPKLSDVRKLIRPHVELTWKTVGDPGTIEAFKVIRRLLVEGRVDGPQVIDRQTTIAASRIKSVSYVVATSTATWKFTDKQLHPNSTNVYLYSVVTITQDGESVESNKIELHP